MTNAMTTTGKTVALVTEAGRVVFWGEWAYETADGWVGIRVDGEGGRVDEAPADFVRAVSAPR